MLRKLYVKTSARAPQKQNETLKVERRGFFCLHYISTILMNCVTREVDDTILYTDVLINSSVCCIKTTLLLNAREQELGWLYT